MHALCCGKGFPLQVSLTAGQAGDAPQLLPLLKGALQQYKRPKVLAADKGYDSQEIRKGVWAERIRPQIPEKELAEGKKRRRKGRKPQLIKEVYRQRNVVERLFGKLKDMRRFACRFDKLAENYMAFIQLACMRICLKPYFSDTP